MIELGAHTNLILGTYAGVALVIGALIIVIVLNARKQSARLAQLEAQGIRRRSDQSGHSATTTTGASHD